MQAADDGLDHDLREYCAAMFQSVDNSGMTAAGDKHSVGSEQSLFFGNAIRYRALPIVEKSAAGIFKTVTGDAAGQIKVSSKLYGRVVVMDF